MSDLKSSVLILGPKTQKAKEIGADFFSSFEDFVNETAPLSIGPNVLIIDLSISIHLATSDWLNNLKVKWPRTQVIAIANIRNIDKVKELINTGHIFKVLPGFDDSYFELSVQEALATSDLLHQTEILVQLSEEQNQQLLTLQKDLEARVEKRQQNLSESREKLILSNRRIESFHRAIVAIQKAKTVKDIERFVSSALNPSFSIESVRISFQSFSHSLNSPSQIGIFTTPLVRNGINIGYATFLKKEPFSELEQNSLDQLSTAIALAIDRLAKFEQAEILKQQWEDTFNAITDPVVIIDSNYNAIRYNSSFIDYLKFPPTQTQPKCYAVLFNRTKPCENCKLGSRFELSNKSNRNVKTFLVSSQEVNDEGAKTFINIYNDITERRVLEKQIIESAKLSELGTVGGSIAHELNNPIAGMLTFTQLIRMDLKGDEWYFDDLSEIEKGIIRCRDTIQDLLSSLRKIARTPVKTLKKNK